MALATALNAAMSGLRTAQAGMDLVASNVANANSVGYSRRTLAPVEAVLGERTGGVKTGAIQRVLDTIVQKQLRLETAGAAYTSTMARFAGGLDRLFGQPGSVGALDTSVNDFTKALQALAADPASSMTRGSVLSSANILASHIASIAEGVQAMRSEAEGRITTAVDRANNLLTSIAQLDSDIQSSPTAPAAPGLLDERDRLITELSQLMDVQVMNGQGGSLTIMTGAGLTLYNGGKPIVLSFDGRGRLAPEATFSTDAAERGVGTITATTIGGMTIDVIASGLIRSSEIGAAIELRDGTLVQVQRQLDELAAGLAQALSDRSVAGTARPAGPPDGFDIDLAGLQAGNIVTLDYRDNVAAAARRILLVPTSGPATIPPGDTPDPSAIIIPFSVPLTGASVAALQTELANRGINLSVSLPAAGTLRILDDGAAGTTDVTEVSAGITVTGMASGYPQLPLFVDSGAGNAPYTGAFGGASQLTGFAQRIRVNPSLSGAGLQALVNYAAPPATTPQGDATRPQFLVDALTKTTRQFSAATGIGGIGPAYRTTVAEFGRRLVETQGANLEAAERLDEGQQIALASVESRMADQSGVNVDQEMSQLVQLQTAYGANARVMTAIRDMFDLLMRM
jgi:flagellar hook-associated protein 1 FlgK